MAFQGGDDEANLLVEFYSHAQKVKESEEASPMNYKFSCESYHQKDRLSSQPRLYPQTALRKPTL